MSSSSKFSSLPWWRPLRPWKEARLHFTNVFRFPGPGIGETRTSAWPQAAWLQFPDWLWRVALLSESSSLIWAETGEDSSILKDSDPASAAWIQSHLWVDAELVSRCLAVISKAPHTGLCATWWMRTPSGRLCPAKRLPDSLQNFKLLSGSIQILLPRDTSALDNVWLVKVPKSMKWSDTLLLFEFMFSGMTCKGKHLYMCLLTSCVSTDFF